MARIIKQGRCGVSLSSSSRDCPSKEGRSSKNKGFSSFVGLVPCGSENKGQGQCRKSEKEKTPEDILNEARKKAEAIILEAEKKADTLKEEAESLVAAAKKNAEEIESQAYNLGYEQGHKDGEELGRKQFQVGLQHLEKFLENFKQQTATLSSAYEAQMLQICLYVARAIIEREVSEDKELISRVLSEAMDKTVEGSTITVHLNPRDLENLSQELLSRLTSPGGNPIEFKPDTKVSRGGCMIETDFGLIDASLESRWQCLLHDIKTRLFERTGMELPGELRSLGPSETPGEEEET